MPYRVLLLSILAMIGLTGPAPAQIRTTLFEGWVSYRAIASKAERITSKTWDTLFIVEDKVIRKRSSISTVHYQYGDHDFLKTVKQSSFTIYEQRIRRFTFSHVKRLSKMSDRQIANEIIFKDSIERVRETKRMVAIVPMDSTKIILGYPCRLALVKTRDSYYVPPREYASLVFYTDQLPNLTDEYGDLGGLPLEYWAFSEPTSQSLDNAVHSVATSVVAVPVPEAYFEPRRFYPQAEVKSKIWDGRIVPLQQHPNAAKHPILRPLIKPDQLRKRNKLGRYPWEAY
jgi:hypothetical protein